MLLHAFSHDDFSPGGDEQRLIGLVNRMRNAVLAARRRPRGTRAVERARREELARLIAREEGKTSLEATTRSAGQDNLRFLRRHASRVHQN